MWMAIYNRAKSLDATYSLVGWVWLLFLAITGLSGAAVMAWASSTWSWYWTTFSWAGVAFAFIIAWLVLTSGFALISWAISRHPPLSIILPSSCKMSGEEKRLFVDLQQFVKTDLERLGERISGIFYAMRNIDMGASGDLPFFVIETINKDMIAQLSTIRKMAAGPPRPN
jgi:hypothetical protein